MADSNYTNEEWRVISDAPEYEISSVGRVRRIAPGRGARPGSILKPAVSGLPTTGYLSVALSRNGKPVTRTIHCLVAETFGGPKPSQRHIAAHTDGNRFNNCAGNIRWATMAENTADAKRHGRFRTKLTSDEARAIRDSALPRPVLMKRYGVGYTTIHNIQTRKQWRNL